MKRRDFLQSAAACALAGATGSSNPSTDGQSRRWTGSPAGPTLRRNPETAPARRSNLKLGTQHGDSDEILKIMAALGVTHICATPPMAQGAADWSIDALSRKREHIESFGVKADALRLLYPTTLTRSEIPAVMIGRSPERDKEIDGVCQKIRNASKAGFPMLFYNLSILGVVRTASTRGRGGSKYAAFKYDELSDRDTLTEAGQVSAEESWERIDYFVNRVVPVAEEYKVRMACHPQDPAMPEAQGYRGVHRVLGTVDGLKRFVGLGPSPYHGLNFCQGTVSESLRDPRREILDAIRWFGSRGRIFNVHFRNIKGGFLDFQETFPDDGDVDFLQAIRAYADVGYDGMLMPDHVPKIEGDERGRQAFAFCFGYIRALIQMIEES